MSPPETAVFQKAWSFLASAEAGAVLDPGSKLAQDRRARLHPDAASGNLVQVDEPNPAGGTWSTAYTYDILGHLTDVSMTRGSGTQTRHFEYTTGSGTPPGALLRSATNPETGTVSYAYSNGLITSKTDAKGQKVVYTYDSYNRPTKIQHYPVAAGAEDGCQQVNLTYDSNGVGGFSYLAGRLATRTYSTCQQPGGSPTVLRTDFTDMFSYKQAGQVDKKRLRVARTVTLWNGTVTTLEQNLDATWAYTGSEGQMTSVTYPAGTGGPSAGTYTYGYDSLGRPYSMNDASANVVSSVSYGVAGEVSSISGSAYNETRSYNTRLQLTGLNTVGFSYPATTNNGKILTQSDGTETITYQYDLLNRLISAVGSGSWGQTYAYDGFGNLTGKAPSAGKSASSYSASFSNNKEVGLGYDANGNQTGGFVNADYDVENRLVSVQKTFSSNLNGYGYDPDNRRVYKAVWTWNLGTSAWVLSGEEISFWSGQKMGTYTLALFLPSSPVTTGAAMFLTTASQNVYFASRLVRKIDGLGGY